MSENDKNIGFQVYEHLRGQLVEAYSYDPIEKRHELVECVFSHDVLPDSQTVETLTEDEYLALLTALYCD